MLRTSRVHPKFSAYHCLEDTQDFNRVPWVPPGKRATIFNPLEMCASWGSRALDAWYVGPAPTPPLGTNGVVTARNSIIGNDGLVWIPGVHAAILSDFHLRSFPSQ